MERLLSVKLVIYLFLIISPLAGSSFLAKATVGVKSGDWAKYSVSITWQSTIPDTPEPNLNIEWIKYEVQNVVGNDVVANVTSHYNNETEISSIQTGNILTQTGELGMMFIQANLSQGDSLGTWILDMGSFTTFTLNETVSRNYNGVTRKVNHLNVSVSTYPYEVNIVGYWDKGTGVACELATVMRYEYAGDSTELSWSFTLIETNIWGSSQIWAQWWFWAAIVVIAVAIIVSSIFIRRRRRIMVEAEPSEPSQIVQPKTSKSPTFARFAGQ